MSKVEAIQKLARDNEENGSDCYSSIRKFYF